MTPLELIHQSKNGELKSTSIGIAIRNNKPLPLKDGSIFYPSSHNEELIQILLNESPQCIYNIIKTTRYTIYGYIGGILHQLPLSKLKKLSSTTKTKFKMDIVQCEMIQDAFDGKMYSAEEKYHDVPQSWYYTLDITTSLIYNNFNSYNVKCVITHPIIEKIRTIFKRVNRSKTYTYARWNAADIWLIHNNLDEFNYRLDAVRCMQELNQLMDDAFDSNIIIPISLKKLHNLSTLHQINPREQSIQSFNIVETTNTTIKYYIDDTLYTLQCRAFSKGNNLQIAVKDAHVYHGKMGFDSLIALLGLKIPSFNDILSMWPDSTTVDIVDRIHSVQNKLVGTIFTILSEHDWGVNIIYEIHKYITGLYPYSCKLWKVS